MEKHSPPIAKRRPQYMRTLSLFALVALIPLYALYVCVPTSTPPLHAATILARCHGLTQSAGPPPDFHERTESDRFVPGTKPILIQNAKIWTGLHNGTQVLEGDILVDKGIIQGVGHFHSAQLASYYGLEVVDANGAWVTPGIVDIHSHLGDGSSPALEGAVDDNSFKGTAQPWLRSLDGLNTHDDSYPLSVAGGVTTALVLPGSANAIGGQAFPIKLRHTEERTPTSLLLEPPFTINSSYPDPSRPPRWRHMKHACGENPSRVYGHTRMDTTWAFREAYNAAFQLKKKQDEYCAKAVAGEWHSLGEFPQDLQWEALVDVIRGRVKVNVHCYEAVDLDDMVRLTNEFSFPIAAFHHAHETYLVPDLLKKAFGGAPAVALFATNGRYKREAWRQSEFAPKIHAYNGITVLMKSDHPVLNSRYLMYEAQQAHYFGLPSNLAMASVMSNSASVMGMGHRVGYVRKGWDADLVIWDSHPLALGATPAQVFIDGIAQLESPHVVKKPKSFQYVPKVPNFDEEAKETIEFDGLPPLTPAQSSSGSVAFVNVKSMYTRTSNNEIINVMSDHKEGRVVLVRKGRVTCSGLRSDCFTLANLGNQDPYVIDLQGGSISPALVTFGAPIGLEEIAQEDSTRDGAVPDPLVKSVPKIVGGDSALIRAVDGLQFNTRDALLSYRSGVTSAISAPTDGVFYAGLGTHFSTGAANKLQVGAILQEVTGVHMAVRQYASASVSTQIAALRHLLVASEEHSWFEKVVQGVVPLVIEAHSADIIATLILLKKEVDLKKQTNIRLTISGATEAHLLAQELGEARVGVVVSPSRPFPTLWEDRRILPGPPLTNHSAISKLLSNNVTVGIGILENWSARNTRLDVAWASLEAGGRISKEQALSLASVSLEKLLGSVVNPSDADLVATVGGDLLELEAKVIAILSPSRQLVDIYSHPPINKTTE